MAEQLIKKTGEGYSNVMPKSWIEAITDKSTGESLTHILQGFNMYFLSYTGNTEQTRCQVPKILRKKGLWVTYVKYDGNVYTEWYNSNDIDDKSWGNSSNWRIGNNELVGDLTISANGNWVINGNETEFKAIGEKGNTPLIRIADNKLQVSYDGGDTYNNVSDNPVYTQIRTYNNKLQISTDLGANWTDASDEIAAYFRFNSGQGNNVGNIQISRNNKDWSDLSGNFINNLHISKYIGANETLPTSGIAEGTIYAKGPTYADSDTSHSNPIYRLWVYAYKGNTLAWQDNGEFTSINAGITQELGDSENLVVSQKGIKKVFSKVLISEKISNFPINGGLYNKDIFENEGYHTTDYIDITGATHISMRNVVQTTGGILPYVIYNANKEIISKPEIAGVTDTNINIELTSTVIPMGAKFIRCSNYNKDEGTSYIIVEKLSTNLYEYLQKDSEKIDNAEKSISKIEMTVNGSYSTARIDNFPTNGTLLQDSFLGDTPGYFTTDFIDITNAVKLSLHLVHYGATGPIPWTIYDKDKEIIKSATPLQETKDVDITLTSSDIPIGAKFIRCSQYNNTNYAYVEIQTFTSGIKQNVENNSKKIQLLENKAGNNDDTYLYKGFRLPSQEDISLMSKDNCTIKDGSLIVTRKEGTNVYLFKENICQIEFVISKYWDSNFISLAFGYGNKGTSFAYSRMPTLERAIEPTLFDTDEDVPGIAIDASYGKMSGMYRNPQISVQKVGIGSRCRITKKNGVFSGEIWDETNSCWNFWFIADTNKQWLLPNRNGWNEGKCIGFASTFSTFNKEEIIKDIKITYDSNLSYEVKNNCYKWIALGDSITDINNNNGLSYVGYCERNYNVDCINLGKSGWMMQDYWLRRAEVGWEDAIRKANRGTIVSMFLGTNDFDTISVEVSDRHPTLGTLVSSDDNAKDPNTTLGCMRLIIERILELNPSIRLFVFAPMYREKGKIISSTEYETGFLVNKFGLTIYDYADAIVSVAKEYNIEAFNTARECGLNKLTLQTYTYDDLHLNQVGGELLGWYFGHRLFT